MPSASAVTSPSNQRPRDHVGALALDAVEVASWQTSMWSGVPRR